MSQIVELMKHFETHDSISSLEGFYVYKMMALPRRICDLEERGYEFSKEWKTDPTGKKYKRYTIISKGN